MRSDIETGEVPTEKHPVAASSTQSKTQVQTKTLGRIGRPPKPGALMQPITLTLPPDLIELMRAEQQAQGADSLSAIARDAIGDYLRRMWKRRERVD